MPREPKLVPRELFGQILEYMVIPTFDVVIEYGDRGVIIVRRKIAPYRNTWALPGLRMHKGEEIDDALRRIGTAELGLEIDLRRKVLLGQFVGRFKTEHRRQDLSTGYWVRASASQPIVLNAAHFSAYRLIDSIPRDMGAMYRFYLRRYRALRSA